MSTAAPLGYSAAHPLQWSISVGICAIQYTYKAFAFEYQSELLV